MVTKTNWWPVGGPFQSFCYRFWPEPLGSEEREAYSEAKMARVKDETDIFVF